MLNNQIVFGLTCFVLGGILSPIVNIAKDAIMTWHFRRQHEEIEKGLEEFYDTHIRNDIKAEDFKEQTAGQKTPDPEADVSIIPEEYRAESDPQPEEEDEEERKKREGERGFFS